MPQDKNPNPFERVQNDIDVALEQFGPTGGPFSPGSIGGIVKGTGPATQGLVDFMRRTFPSLMKKADSLPDIKVSINPEITSAGAQFRPSTNGIEINPFSGGGSRPRSAPDNIFGMVHELLHAIYQHKNLGKMYAPSYGPPIEPFLKDPKRKARIAQFIAGQLSPERRLQYDMTQLTRTRPHMFLEAQGKNIYDKAMDTPYSIGYR